jgi:hypothetical protein
MAGLCQYAEWLNSSADLTLQAARMVGPFTISDEQQDH